MVSSRTPASNLWLFLWLVNVMAGLGDNLDFLLLTAEKAVAPRRLQSMRSLRVGHDLSDFTFTFHFHALEKEMATHSSVLAWRIPGAVEPGGLLPMGSNRVRHD